MLWKPSKSISCTNFTSKCGRHHNVVVPQELRMHSARTCIVRLVTAFGTLVSPRAQLSNESCALIMQLAAVKQDKNLLQQERQQLKSKVQELNESVSRLSREKIDLERSLELEEEAFINSLFRQVANVMDNYKAMDEASPCPHVC